MFREFVKQLKTSVILLLLMTILTGVIYPSLITVIAQTLFPWQANGSLIKNNNKVIGSALIGQSFNGANYFWSRPSATLPFPYNAANSGGSNLGPSNPALADLVKIRIANLRQSEPQNKELIPVDLVTASGSGLDPEISPAAAYYQASRVAEARNLSLVQVHQLIDTFTQKPTFDILGEARVNVLELNLALDQLQNSEGKNNVER